MLNLTGASFETQSNSNNKKCFNREKNVFNYEHEMQLPLMILSIYAHQIQHTLKRSFVCTEHYVHSSLRMAHAIHLAGTDQVMYALFQHVYTLFCFATFNHSSHTIFHYRLLLLYTYCVCMKL